MASEDDDGLQHGKRHQEQMRGSPQQAQDRGDVECCLAETAGDVQGQNEEELVQEDGNRQDNEAAPIEVLRWKSSLLQQSAHSRSNRSRALRRRGWWPGWQRRGR